MRYKGFEIVNATKTYAQGKEKWFAIAGVCGRIFSSLKEAKLYIDWAIKNAVRRPRRY